ncbi:MAG TPA: site-specific integrase [Stellaceae bacterium]|nr:site-specific integrase [Stellaceae bacterium]
MPTLKLTQAAVDRLRPPTTGRAEYFDTQLPAFGLRISATGRKSWIVMYRVSGKLVRETLGPFARIPKVDKARELARESMRQAQAGVHPVEARRAAKSAVREAPDTFGAVADLFVERYARRNTRPLTCAETQRLIERELKPMWGDKPIRDIGRKDVIALLDNIVDRGSPVMANRALAHTRRLFNWARERAIVETNPAAGLSKPTPEVQRDRILSDREIRLFWRACGDIGWPFGPLFRLLLVTAQRRSEVAGLLWPELHLADRQWVIPRERAKNDREHVVYLSDLALGIIGRLPRFEQASRDGEERPQAADLVFTTTGETAVSGISKAKERLDAKMLELLRKELMDAGEDPNNALVGKWVLHDLRRTAATGMAALNVAPHVVDRILNHVSGTIRGVAAVYNRHAYLEERKAGLEAWGGHLIRLVRA